MKKPRNFEELLRWLKEQGDEDLADSIVPLEQIASPELVEKFPILKNLALVALAELSEEELEEMRAELELEEEEGESVWDRRITGFPNLAEKASMCELIAFDDLLNWLEQNGVRFEGER